LCQSFVFIKKIYVQEGSVDILLENELKSAITSIMKNAGRIVEGAVKWKKKH